MHFGVCGRHQDTYLFASKAHNSVTEKLRKTAKCDFYSGGTQFESR